MITFILGTRPEIIKVAPVVKALQRQNAGLTIVHTGQHYSFELDAVFFDELELPQPFANLEVGSCSAAKQLGTIVVRAAEVLDKLQPNWVVVQGDTNSVLGGALAAHKLGLRIAHLEAGLRSDDWEMPEEANRVVTGRLAAMHLCPTDVQVERLRMEGIVEDVYIVGNTAVDAALINAERAAARSTIIERLDLVGKPYALVTLHRPSNVDSAKRLTDLLQAFSVVSKHFDLPLVFPTHPRTRMKIDCLKHDGFSKLPFISTDPLGYLDFLRLLGGAKFVMTDSGGVQEEACTLHVPCITLRANTERPETVDVGANSLCYSRSASELKCTIDAILTKQRSWFNPFGDGHASERVVDLLLAR